MSALKEPMASLDRNKPYVLTRSIFMFNELIKMYIGEMTGEVRKPYHGLSLRCRLDQCTYKLNHKEIVADGNCLFHSLLYILGRNESHASQMALRRELYQHFIDNEGIHNGNDLEVAKVTKEAYASIHVIKSFTELYRKNVIVFELHNSGVFNAHLFVNRSIPFDHVEFLILTQNPGHFTTFTKNRDFVQSPAFLEKILDIDYAWTRGRKIRDLIRPGQVIPDFEERNYSQVIFSNYDEFADIMMGPLPQLPDNLGLPPLPHLAPLLPLDAFPSMVEANGKAIGSSHTRSPSLSPATKAAIAAMNKSPRRSGSHGSRRSHKSRGSRSPSLSPATKAAIAAMNKSPRRSGSKRSHKHGSRSPSLSPATKAAIAAMNKSPGRSGSKRSDKHGSRSPSLSPRTKAEIARMNALASRSGTLSPATKKAIANMNKSAVSPATKERIARLALSEAPNASPATKERIARLALSEAPNASINTMNQIGRLHRRMSQRRNPLRNGGAGAASEAANSPVADLRRTRRFKPSSIVGRTLARPFARIFGKF
jgi:hypothetical protein